MKQPLSLSLERTVLLCIDLQEERRQDERLLAIEFDRVIANVARLQAAARKAGVPLYHFAYAVDAAAARPPCTRPASSTSPAGSTAVPW